VRVTAFEQSPLKISARAYEETNCLNPAQALALMDLSERMGARIAAWQGPKFLQIQQFVGVVKTGDLQIEILPKLDSPSDPFYIRKSLLAMLAATQDVRVHASEMVGFLESSEPFICALARLYCHRLLEAVRSGLRQEYVLHHDLLSHIRGKVDWPTQAKQHATQRLEFNCIFDERSADTPLNRALKAALLRAGIMLERARNASLVTELRHAMDGVSNACPTAEQVARLRTDRMNRHMEPLLALAKLILGNRNPDLGRSAQGDRNTYALVWDMNMLFEEYVGRLTQQVLEPKGFRVDLQDKASIYLAEETTTKQNAFLLKPDILVRLGRMPYVVADTKWKRLDSQQTNLGVSGVDVYQILTYALRYGTERAALVYPHHPALGVPGIQREFRIQVTDIRQVQLRVITLGLAELAGVPDQIQQGLLPNYS
jgi:5-methylcytosine-specific restriction enzyme subunit McrC